MIGKRDTWKPAPLTYETFEAATERARERLAMKPDRIEELEAVGRERALVLKTLVLTGLRSGELRSITIGQVFLDGPAPFIELEAADEKNRDGSDIQLRADLAEDIRGWLRSRQNAAPLRLDGKVALPADSPLFNVPTGLRRILDRDLKAAGIPKRDDRGRTIDVHALRHTFGTMLSQGGVAPRTAQAAMRHSSIDLTMNVYTEPRLLDVAGAMESLPNLPLDSKARQSPKPANRQTMRRPPAPRDRLPQRLPQTQSKQGNRGRFLSLWTKVTGRISPRATNPKQAKNQRKK
ncbi:MAG: site-specific integrase, partial [Planctomycetota bacterium]|nr:site-specific integrase [Planctomycetota bacterium]